MWVKKQSPVQVTGQKKLKCLYKTSHNNLKITIKKNFENQKVVFSL